MNGDLNPWRTGAALSTTIIVGYAICTVIFYVWPGAAMAFMNALFHGLDFGKLEPAAPWSVFSFVCTVLVMATWGFLMGALFASIYNRLGESAARRSIVR
jgi:hypothetical protein